MSVSSTIARAFSPTRAPELYTTYTFLHRVYLHRHPIHIHKLSPNRHCFCECVWMSRVSARASTRKELMGTMRYSGKLWNGKLVKRDLDPTKEMNAEFIRLWRLLLSGIRVPLQSFHLTWSTTTSSSVNTICFLVDETDNTQNHPTNYYYNLTALARFPLVLCPSTEVQ